MRQKLILDGRYRIFDDGSIYRILPDGTEVRLFKRPAKYKYFSICFFKEGKEQHRYVHRLIAEAFVPNPANAPIVHHKDGDPHNNAASNLEWVTEREHRGRCHAGTPTLTRRLNVVCRECGKPLTDWFNKRRICPECKNAIEADNKRKRLVQKRRELVEGYSLDVLTEKQKKTMLLWLNGMRASDIAKFRGITKQGVSSCISTALRRMRRRAIVQKPRSA